MQLTITGLTARAGGLWRQRIQDYMIAAVQNIRIMLTAPNRKPKKANGAVSAQFKGVICACSAYISGLLRLIFGYQLCTGTELNSVISYKQ
jgi:hypothetical protein